jgi:midasin (ATPase involved in ribosome maturation)
LASATWLPQITVEDLQGRTVLFRDVVTGQEGFKLLDSPFVTAFQEGSWLLLDEFNLAPDNVLQWIERVIDTGRIEVWAYGAAAETCMLC